MSIEGFIKLKEIDSLSKMRLLQLQMKLDQEDRLRKLNLKKTQAQEELDQLTKGFIHQQNEVAETEKALKIASEQRDRLLQFAGEDQKILKLTDDIHQLEEKGLDQINYLEELQTQIADKKTFLNGISLTIDEITQEVQDEMIKINKEISNLDYRIELLIEELPDQFRDTYLKLEKKKLAQGPFSRIDQGSCYFCRFKISRIEESEIDIHKNLKTCPQCSRIFLPYGS